MKCRSVLLLVGLLVLSLGCAAKYQTVEVPPRVDLSQLDLIAVVDFYASSEGELAPLATRRFMDLARRDQGLVRMLSVDQDAGHPPDAAALRELGQRYGAQTVLVGALQVSDIRPELSVANTLRSGKLTANVDATLTVELVETASGASIWSASARASRTIGQVSLFDGKHFTFDAEDPERAYGPLIDALVGQVTADFQTTWVRQPIPK